LAQFIQCIEENKQNANDELIAGLTAEHPFTSPKYLYDALGSRLFEAICELPEYYPTRTEAEIFRTHAQDIARSVGTGTTLIDLGAGNCAKAAGLFPVLQPAQYVPIDISVEFLRESVGKLQQNFPQVDIAAIGMDFSSGLTLPDAVRTDKRLFFYPGSSIGNFTPDESLAFLERIRSACGTDGGVLISVDLVKEKSLLDAAYDDALGVTAAFNLNMLRHLNHVLGTDFDVREWRHRGFFNPDESRIEMHLEAMSDLTVGWPGGTRRFERGERIHTENSYKYTRAGFSALLTQAGFKDVTIWADPQGWFIVCHARVS
jgi:dimethylhistidine N-methyltransferase